MGVHGSRARSCSRSCSPTSAGRTPQTGGPYAYARRAFGDFAGFWTAWGYWIAAWAGNAAIAAIFVSYASVFWPSLGTDNVLAFAVGLSVIWVLTLVNIAGVRESGIIQLVTTVLKFVPLLLIGLIGLFYMHSGNFTPFDPNHVCLVGHWHAISFAATLTLWAFLGLESATVPAEEVKDPERTLPRATMLGTIVTTALYVLATVAIMGVIPAATLADSNAPFADAAREIFGSSVLGISPDKLVAAVAMISTFGALNGWILIQGRVPLAAAQDGLFPKAFAQVSGIAQDAGRRPRGLVGAAERADGDELPVVADRHVHEDHHPGHHHHARAVRVRRGRRS